MTNSEKAEMYDALVRASDKFQLRNSKLKSEYTTNIPPIVQQEIEHNNREIGKLVKRLESLFL
jgi:hypothetical protein